MQPEPTKSLQRETSISKQIPQPLPKRSSAKPLPEGKKAARVQSLKIRGNDYSQNLRLWTFEVELCDCRSRRRQKSARRRINFQETIKHRNGTRTAGRSASVPGDRRDCEDDRRRIARKRRGRRRGKKKKKAKYTVVALRVCDCGPTRNYIFLYSVVDEDESVIGQCIESNYSNTLFPPSKHE
ncbi:hypothetical protein H6P81_009690 [Aristolochia fimbriata]|uniref:Uncharacterized protein n=1 Tax=Aristolochia fimbriata TaxID=158543 RepID=A0AAV7ENN5_ARIFI|nr:hypothetical protein H6P81_009690 [Aristolochia fimbriata]